MSTHLSKIDLILSQNRVSGLVIHLYFLNIRVKTTTIEQNKDTFRKSACTLFIQQLKSSNYINQVSFLCLFVIRVSRKKQ